MARKRVDMDAVLNAFGERELGRAIQRTVEREGTDATKWRLGRRFQRELRRRASYVRINDRHIK